ncbi:MAG: hypothetical protein JO090_02035 [Rhizobacter sp.]|nr:hypothetical protein [Rhizobacter sp.]
MSALPAQVLLCAAWFWLVLAHTRQNDPRLARLVPGHVTAIRLSLGAWALCFVAASTAISAIVRWPTVAAAVVAFAMAAVIAIGARVFWFGGVALVVVAVPGLRDAGWLAIEAAWRAAPALLASLVLVATTLALHRVVMEGGDRHVRMHRARLAWIAAGASRSVTDERKSLPWWRGWLAERPYAAWMRYRLSRPGRGASSRLILGMGPHAHWTTMAMYGLLCVAFVVAFVVADRLLAPSRAKDGPWFLLAFNFLLTSTFFSQAMWRSRREQALLRLLPGAPAAASVNRWLARHFATQYVVMALVCGVVLFALRPLSRVAVLDQEISLSLLCLAPLVPIASWRDWTRMKEPKSNLTIHDLLVIAGTSGAAITWSSGRVGPWWLLGLLALSLSVPLGLWRWHAIARTPAAWPVGRAR